MSIQHDSSSEKPARARSLRTDWWILAIIGTLFLVFRVPLMYRQPGGLDEAEFSVLGVTIVREGIPRVPYIVSRDPGGYFYRYDEILLSHPPASFYWQAVFQGLLPPGYGTARLASGAAAILAIVLVYSVGHRLTGSRGAALWGAGLYSLSRVFYFPAMSSRPDMLCGMLGFAAFAAFLRWRDGRRVGWLIGASAFVGLGGLAHPFAIIYAVQLGVWALLIPGSALARLRNLAILVTGAILVFSLWLFLIVPHMDVFQSQFFNNVVNRSTPGLLQRFFWPSEAIQSQTRMILELAQPIQTALMFGALLMVTAVGGLRRDSKVLKLVAIAWSSVYLLTVFEGIHATKGYWCYPGGWLFLCVGWCVAWVGEKAYRLGRWRIGSDRSGHIPAVLGAACVVLAMVPGSGIQTWVAHIRHWNEPTYDARQFVRTLLRRVPREAHVIVDIAYILPFYLDDRSVSRADSYDLSAPDDYEPFDYYIAGPESIAHGFPQKLGGRFVESFGDQEDVFACYAELYESTRPGGS
ncbi:MAG: ArnT family glycosyltransferase [Thermoguttaceae bacterium]